MKLILTIVISFLLGLGGGQLIIPALRALKAGQPIREIGPTWHASKSGTPTMGGAIFILAVIAAVVAAIPDMLKGDLKLLFVCLLSLAFGVIGFFDDYIKVKKKHNLGLKSWQKLALQLAASLLFLLLLKQFGYLSNEIYVPFAQVTFKLNWWIYIFFAIFVIIGSVNAVNLTDGVDGLCGSVTVPVMVYFAVMCAAYRCGSLTLFPASLAAGLAAYLVYNWHPAMVFMGDTGSLFLGGAVCAMAFALDMPLVLVPVGLIYIAETVSVIMQVTYFKLTHGKRIFKMTPIHHHFEMSGWKEEKIVCVFTLVTAVMCILTWLGTRGRIF